MNKPHMKLAPLARDCLVYESGDCEQEIQVAEFAFSHCEEGYSQWYSNRTRVRRVDVDELFEVADKITLVLGEYVACGHGYYLNSGDEPLASYELYDPGEWSFELVEPKSEFRKELRGEG